MRNKRKVVHRLIIGSILCCALFVVLAVYANMLRKQLNESIIRELKEVSEQSVVLLSGEIEQEFAILKEIAGRISVRQGFDPEKAVSELRSIVYRHSFMRMGIIMPDGTSYNTDYSEMYLGDREFFKESMRGNAALSDRLIDRASGGNIIVFSQPLYEGEDVCAVLFATYAVDDLQELLGVSVFGGKGYSYVVTQSGDAVIDTNSEIGFVNFENVYRSLEDASDKNMDAAEDLKAGIESSSTGYIRFNNKMDKYMYYAPLGVRNWYVLNVVPAGVMDSTMTFIMELTYILCSVLVFIFFVLVVYIIKIERQKKKELSDILYVDSVTGGYSYARFCAEAPVRLENTELEAAYIVMDIDKFKLVNELFGYEDGNRTLCYVWSVWKKCSRENEIYARRIADRFVAIWYFKEREELNVRIENFMTELQSRVQLQQKSDYNLKVSMGIYLIQDRKEAVQSMMNYALMAQATVKGQEGSWYAFYDDDFKAKLLENKMLEDQMKHALKHDEFIVYYQPKYNVMTKELVGAEALVRWKKADGSMVMPGRFIPLAEENGFIRYLDKYIFTAVCKKQKEWMNEGRQVVPVSVNLSRRHLYNGEFMEEYQNIVEESGVPYRYVQLELTESAIFENQEALCQIIDRLHMMGFRILMDDFGTGYSSLMMLKSVPIDVLKLDKSFVDDFDDPRGEQIITSVIRLAQALHIEVTAEGVETEEQYTFLKQLGCNMVQGYYFAKPMPEEEFEKLLKEEPIVPDKNFTTIAVSC